MLVLSAVGWMVVTNAEAPKRKAALEDALRTAGYEVVEAYPGARGAERCGRHTVQYVWKARTADGEACVSRYGVRLINLQPKAQPPAR